MASSSDVVTKVGDIINSIFSIFRSRTNWGLVIAVISIFHKDIGFDASQAADATEKLYAAIGVILALIGHHDKENGANANIAAKADGVTVIAKPVPGA